MCVCVCVCVVYVLELQYLNCGARDAKPLVARQRPTSVLVCVHV